MLRYFNPVGAHSSGLLSERPHGVPENLMPYLLRVASGLYDFLEIYGDIKSTAELTKDKSVSLSFVIGVGTVTINKSVPFRAIVEDVSSTSFKDDNSF